MGEICRDARPHKHLWSWVFHHRLHSRCVQTWTTDKLPHKFLLSWGQRYPSCLINVTYRLPSARALVLCADLKKQRWVVVKGCYSSRCCINSALSALSTVCPRDRSLYVENFWDTVWLEAVSPPSPPLHFPFLPEYHFTDKLFTYISQLSTRTEAFPRLKNGFTV